MGGVSGSYDVAIVGAGLAGLAAAGELRSARVIVLEREARAGGRVLTAGPPGGRLDLGACFGFNPEILPGAAAPDAGGLIGERGPIGIFHQGALTFGASPWDCIEQMSISPEVRDALTKFRSGDVDASALPPGARRIAQAFFAQIHPGDIGAYARDRQADALRLWFPDHWASGNEVAVATLQAHANAELLLGCAVFRLDEREDHVDVTFEREGRLEQVTAAVVVVATPATVARRLVTPSDSACADFLATVEYGRYIVVGLSVTGDDGPLPDFRYLVTPDLALSLVMQQRSRDRSRRSLLCYYDDDASRQLDGDDDQAVLAATRSDLRRLGVLSAGDAGAVFEGVARWEVSGTIMSPAYAAARRLEHRRASERVFLAGDYLAMTPGWGYGMDDAVSCGREVGQAIRAAYPTLGA